MTTLTLADTITATILDAVPSGATLRVVTYCAHCTDSHVAKSSTYKAAAVEARAAGWFSEDGNEWWSPECQAAYWRSGSGL